MSEFLSLEKELNDELEGRETDVLSINLPMTDEYVTNSRNQKIHVRSYLPEMSDPVGLVVFIHGYTAHINSPMYPLYAREICKEGFGFITFDLHGHGYSDGVKKALIEDDEHLLDDVRCVLRALYAPSEVTSPFQIKLSGFKCPFVLTGQSMGGAINIALSLELNEKKSNPIDDPIAKWYRGSVLLCPAVSVPKPHSIVLSIFEYIILPFMPHQSVPEFMSNVHSLQYTLETNSLQQYFAADGYPKNPNGLTFSDPIRYQTAYSVLKFFDKVLNRLDEVSFPFIVMHDEEDAIVSITGTRSLMEESMTTKDNKEFIPMPGGRHDLFHNRASDVVRNIVKFTKKQFSCLETTDITCM